MTDGEGNCCCADGTAAGLGREFQGTRWHKEGAPGCLFGPKESRGVSAYERKRRARAAYMATVPVEQRQLAGKAFTAGWDAHESGK